jgi:hypothetical protein
MSSTMATNCLIEPSESHWAEHGQDSPARSLIDLLLAMPISELRKQWEMANPKLVMICALRQSFERLD